MFPRLLAAAAALLAGVLLHAQAPAPLNPAVDLPLSPTLPSVQTIVVDPGHGGDDSGVKVSGDRVEKQFTLAIAKRIKALVESRLGLRVVLTREDDRTISADDRALIANNSRGSLFLSLHFNAALAPSISGAQVYSAAADRESQDALRRTQAAGAKITAATGVVRSIDFVRWDMAQARHVEQSAALAGMLAEGFSAVQLPMASRPIQQAPLRVLGGLDMPAALVELAYLTNPTQAKEADSPEFQTLVAQAVHDAVLRFRSAARGEQ